MHLPLSRDGSVGQDHARVKMDPDRVNVCVLVVVSHYNSHMLLALKDTGFRPHGFSLDYFL